MSRQPTWDLACELQASMFDAAASVGGLSVQLVYFRGIGESRASPWVADARAAPRSDDPHRVPRRPYPDRQGAAHVRREAEKRIRSRRSPMSATRWRRTSIGSASSRARSASSASGLHVPRGPRSDRRKGISGDRPLTDGAYLPFNAASANELRIAPGGGRDLRGGRVEGVAGEPGRRSQAPPRAYAPMRICPPRRRCDPSRSAGRPHRSAHPARRARALAQVRRRRRLVCAGGASRLLPSVCARAAAGDLRLDDRPARQADRALLARRSVVERALGRAGDEPRSRDRARWTGAILAGRHEGRQLVGARSRAGFWRLPRTSAATRNRYVSLKVISTARIPGWRDDVEADARDRHGPAPGTGSMSTKEAYQILGLDPGAGDAEVRQAHRRLMKQVHPDRGGSAALAAKINEAKDRILGRHR